MPDAGLFSKPHAPETGLPLPSRTRRLLLGVLCLALILRLVHFWAISQTAFLKFPLAFTESDLHGFWVWAHRILGGDWLGRDTYHPYYDAMKQVAPVESWYRWWGGKEIFHQAPLYPYLLGALLSVKDSPGFVILIQLLLGCLHPLIMFFLGRRLFDEREGLMAAALTALYGPLLFHQGVLLRDWLPPIWEPLILLMVLRATEQDRTAAWLSAGLVMGLATLTKESACAVIVLTSLWLAFQFRDAWHGAVRPLGLVLAGFLLCLTPLAARNLVVGAPLLSISVQGSGAILYGLAADNDPIGFQRPPSVAEAIREGRDGSPVPALRRALSTYHGDYLGLGRHLLRKLRGILDPYEVPNNVSVDYGREISPVLAFLPGYGLILPLGVVGFTLAAYRRTGNRLLFIYLGAALTTQLVTILLARFRLALVPVLILAAAFALVRLWDLVRAQAAWPAAGVVLLALSTAAAQHWVIPPDRLPPTAANLGYTVAAAIYAEEQRFPDAIDEVLRLRQWVQRRGLPPELAIEAATLEGDYQLQWALDLVGRQREDEARSHVRIAEQVYATLPETSHASYNLGLMYLKVWDREKARGFFARFLAIEPAGSRADQVRRLVERL